MAAAVKAEGYGHGLVRTARALDADAFAVACVEEALALREAGIDRRILLLEGVFEAEELPRCASIWGRWFTICGESGRRLRVGGWRPPLKPKATVMA